MTSPLQRFTELSWHEQFLFVSTNLLPRRLVTQLVGRLSKVEQPLIKQFMLWVWQLFCDDLRLFEAQKSRFRSVHDCFVRELKPGARQVDTTPGSLASPCDAVVGAMGTVVNGQVLQIKGAPYDLTELFGCEQTARNYEGGRFCTLRLKSSMYHHFHAPCDGTINRVTYISGDVWNVNPPTLKVIDGLFTKNERAVLEIEHQGMKLAIVAVAAVLVASMRIHGLQHPLNLQYNGANELELKRKFAKGDPLGYFEHGSTLVLFTPNTFQFANSVQTGEIIRMGERLMAASSTTTGESDESFLHRKPESIQPASAG